MPQLTLPTHLHLAHNRLTGPLPDLSTCSFLSTLDVSRNRLSGPVSLSALLPTRLSPPSRPPAPATWTGAPGAADAAASDLQARVSSVVELRLEHNHFSEIILPSSTHLRCVGPSPKRAQKTTMELRLRRNKHTSLGDYLDETSTQVLETT